MIMDNGLWVMAVYLMPEAEALSLKINKMSYLDIQWRHYLMPLERLECLMTRYLMPRQVLRNMNRH